MDYLAKRIIEKLKARGEAEQQRAEEWQRSLKPTIYRGNNLFQELGGEPIEGRYLGQVGLVPGQSVPNIARNLNKPVIPGLPVVPIAIAGSEETKVIKYPADIVFLLDVSGSFEDDLPVWQANFPILLNQIKKQVSVKFGVGSFSDQPLSVIADYAFRNDTGFLLQGEEQVIEVVNNLKILSGADFPESQMYALLQASLSTIDPTTGYADEFTEYDFQAKDRIIVLITDAIFHYNEEGAPGWLTPGNGFYPTRRDVATSLYVGDIQLFCLIQDPDAISVYESFLNTEYVYDNPATGQSESFFLKGEVSALEPDSSDLVPVLTSLLRKILVFTEQI